MKMVNNQKKLSFEEARKLAIAAIDGTGEDLPMGLVQNNLRVFAQVQSSLLVEYARQKKDGHSVFIYLKNRGVTEEAVYNATLKKFKETMKATDEFYSIPEGKEYAKSIKMLRPDISDETWERLKKRISETK
jgi:hypothetical protein